MTTKTGQFSVINSKPALSVAKDGTVFYSNKVGESLLHYWDIRVGEKLPLQIEIFVQKALSRKSIEKTEIKIGKRVYFIVFYPLPEQESLNIYKFDRNKLKKIEEKTLESETQEKANPVLANIIDVQVIQSLMEDFYKLANIPIALVDLKGSVLVGVGWQDICVKFHRVHPEACKNCMEGNIELFSGVFPGEFKLSKCRNSMWDIATPIIVGDQHVGYAFSGQFFFEGEPLDYELFRAQAKKYGFNEEEYIAALERVPRLSQMAVNTCMSFLTTFANMVSQLGYSNTKLAQSLAEYDSVVDTLRESEKRERARSEELEAVLDAVPVAVFITHDSQAFRITGNRLSYEWVHLPVGTNFSKSAPKGEKPEMFKLFKNGVEMQPSDMPSQMAAKGIEVNNFELDVVSADGKIRHVLGNARPLRDEQGNPRGSVSAFIDITGRKKVEEAFRLSYLYNRSLIEASLDPLVTIGPDGKITDVNGATEQVTGYSRNELIGTDFSDYFTESEKARAGYKQVFMDGAVRDYPLEIQHKDGHITPVLYNASVYRDKNGEIIGVFAAARDITERKKAEAAVKKVHDNLEKLVEERTAELEKSYISLKESESSLAEAQRMTHIGSWDWNLVTGKVYWSEELYRIFGRSPQEPGATYDEFLSYVHPDDRDRVSNAIKKGLNGEPIAGDYRIILANGEERIVHTEAEVVFHEKNNPVQMKGTVQDITERKRVEEQIKTLANIVESSNDAIGTMTLDGNITSWNQEAEHVYGYSVEEVLGKPVSVLAPPHLDKETIKLIEEIKHGKKIQHYRTLRERKGGTTICVSITLSPVFDSYGKLIAISFISRDITERKKIEEKLQESEEKYRNIVETANEGISIIDTEERITFVNKKTEDMLGYSSEEFIGKSMWDFLSDESKVIIKQKLEKEWKNVNESFEIKFIRKDGSPIWTHTNSKSLFDKDGKFFGTLNLHTDITKRKEAEEALRKFEIARKKEIHHRIKNNLQVISSLLDLQAEMFKGRSNIKDSEVLNAFTVSMDRVLSIALIHEELYKGENIDVLNFSEYIKKLADNLLLTYRLETDVNLNLDLEENLFLDMDAAIPLGIIINELVSNSLKYAFPERDKGEIRIKLRREEKEECISSREENKSNIYKRACLALIVSDDGIGIPEEFDIKNLNSLGFQLVTSLVDQLDGEFELKRKNGTEFTMTFTVTEKR